MTDFLQKFFSSKLTTAALVAGLGLAGFIIFGGFGGEEEAAKSVNLAAGKAAEAAETSRPDAVADAASEGAPAEDNSLTDDLPDRFADAAGTSAQEVGDAPSDALDARPESREVRAQPAPDPVRIAAAADASGANSFNRLLKRPASAPNAPPARDGIHDADNPGTSLLQWPSVAFEDLPKTSDGNKVDWVKALESGEIKPRYEVDDPNAEPFLLDLVIVRQVKGSMPNVVYPHLQHTQWLDCSNCHDEIFTPQKGANQISMAGILLGQKCGVCHGKVAFPVSDCRRCHAQPKTEEELRALASRSSWTNESGD